MCTQHMNFLLIVITWWWVNVWISASFIASCRTTSITSHHLKHAGLMIIVFCIWNSSKRCWLKRKRKSKRRSLKDSSEKQIWFTVKLLLLTENNLVCNCSYYISILGQLFQYFSGCGLTGRWRESISNDLILLEAQRRAWPSPERRTNVANYI